MVAEAGGGGCTVYDRDLVAMPWPGLARRKCATGPAPTTIVRNSSLPKLGLSNSVC